MRRLLLVAIPPFSSGSAPIRIDVFGDRFAYLREVIGLECRSFVEERFPYDEETSELWLGRIGSRSAVDRCLVSSIRAGGVNYDVRSLGCVHGTASALQEITRTTPHWGPAVAGRVAPWR